MSLIISGFPGVGKSTLFLKYGEARVSDSDSSKFPKDKFPANYLNHIKRMSKQKEFVLVSSHEEVRKGLVDCNLPYVLVYPNLKLKAEYIARYKQRGSSDEFVALMEKNWESFIASCRAQLGCEHIELDEGQFLEDVI